MKLSINGLLPETGTTCSFMIQGLYGYTTRAKTVHVVIFQEKTISLSFISCIGNGLVLSVFAFDFPGKK